MDAPNMTKAEIYNEQYDSAVNLQKTNESWDSSVVEWVDWWSRGVDWWNRGVVLWVVESTGGIVESTHESWSRLVESRSRWIPSYYVILKNGHFQNRLHESTTPRLHEIDSTTPRSKLSQQATPLYFAIGYRSLLVCDFEIFEINQNTLKL